MRDAAGHFVQGGEDSDLVLDGLGVKPFAGQRHGTGHHGRKKRPADESLPIHGNPSALHHPAHLMPPNFSGHPQGCALP